MKKVALAAWMLAATAAPSQGAGYDDLNVAISHFNQGRLDIAVSWFDKALAAGDLIPDLRRIAYVDRGLAHEAKGDGAKALADFTAAIAVQPTDLFAYRERAAIYLANNELEKALTDYKELDRLRPRDYLTLMNIGQLNWQLDRVAVGADAFSVFAGADTYSWLWQQLTSIRLGKPMAEYKVTFDTRDWPGHLPRFYLGDLSESDVMEAAESANRNNSVCTAHVFTGLWHVTHNDQAGATPLLEAAVKKCSEGSPMWRIARSELGKIIPKDSPK